MYRSMKIYLCFCTFLIFFTSVLSWAHDAAQKISYASKHSAAKKFGAWEKEGVPSGDLMVKFKIALWARNRDLLESLLIQISTPGSPRFRKYLSTQEVVDMIAPDDLSISRATAWLSGHSHVVRVIETPLHRDWLVVEAPVSAVENMFSCSLSYFRHRKTQMVKIATADSYVIPAEISDVIELVAGLNTFISGNKFSSSSPGVSSTGVPSSITPSTIYSVYGVDSSGSSGNKLGSQAVVEFGYFANFNEEDLQKFFSLYQPSLLGETVGMAYGTNNGTAKPSVEANLDVQYIMATGVYVNTTDYKITSSYPGESIEDEFLEYTYIVNNQTDPPLSQSISYGEYGGSYDNATDQRFSYELQKMGISGVSVLLASGDNGVGCNAAGTSQEFDYPSSPYITMVGATYLDVASQKEVGATLSSGGFSKDFMQASWQSEAVEAYLSSGVILPAEDYYAPGRAYPDVAAFGQNVQVVASGKSEAVSGTSCSAPIFAGVIALINHELLSKNLPPLGFLNPWLYANPQMFTDVTEGSNPYQKCEGFYAAPGWDPVTGMGTPLFPKMLEAAFST